MTIAQCVTKKHAQLVTQNVEDHAIFGGGFLTEFYARGRFFEVFHV